MRNFSLETDCFGISCRLWSPPDLPVSPHAQPFVICPFSGLRMLEMELHPKVIANWNFRHEQSNRNTMMICEFQGHWIFLHGLWTSLEHGVHWTLYDGLRMNHVLPWALQITHRSPATSRCTILASTTASVSHNLDFILVALCYTGQSMSFAAGYLSFRDPTTPRLATPAT